MLTVTFYLGKPMSGISCNYLLPWYKTIMCKLQGPHRAVTEYTHRRCCYLTDGQRWSFLKFTAQSSSHCRRQLPGLRPCETVWLLCSGPRSPTVQASVWSFPRAPQRHTGHHHRFLHLPLKFKGKCHSIFSSGLVPCCSETYADINITPQIHEELYTHNLSLQIQRYIIEFSPTLKPGLNCIQKNTSLCKPKISLTELELTKAYLKISRFSP